MSLPSAQLLQTATVHVITTTLNQISLILQASDTFATQSTP